jgi:hypothetical protein
MMGCSRFVIPGLTLCMGITLASPGAAQTYHDDQHHYSIELPRGWIAMPQKEVDQVNARLGGGLLGGGVHYDAGLRKSSGRLGTFPYALIQTVPSPPGGSSYQEIEKSLAVDLKTPIKEARGRLGDLVKDLKVGQPVLNRETNCIILRTQITAPGVGEVKGFSVGHLGRDNVVFVHCYAKGNDFDAAMPVFRRINDWFSFDKGYDFKPGAGGAARFSWSSVGRSSIIGGAVGLIVGLAGFLIRFLAQPRAAGNASSVNVSSPVDPFSGR